MGMFDTITVRVGLPDSFPRDQEPVFQTKCLDCLLREFEIREDKKLYLRKVEYKFVEPAEGNSLLDKLPYSEEVSSSWELYPFTGHIIFYTSVEDKWLDYRAHIIHGHLIDICEFDSLKPINDSDSSKETLEESLQRVADIISSLHKAQDYYYDKLVSEFAEEITEDMEPFVFDYCFNSFGSIESIKEKLKRLN